MNLLKYIKPFHFLDDLINEKENLISRYNLLFENKYNANKQDIINILMIFLQKGMYSKLKKPLYIHHNNQEFRVANFFKTPENYDGFEYLEEARKTAVSGLDVISAFYKYKYLSSFFILEVGISIECFPNNTILIFDYFKTYAGENKDGELIYFLRSRNKSVQKTDINLLDLSYDNLLNILKYLIDLIGYF